MAENGGTVLVESGVTDATIEALGERGHTVERDAGSFGGYQGILIDAEHGVLRGATDPRKDGTAVGY